MADAEVTAALEGRVETEGEERQRKQLVAVNVFIEKLRPHMADVLPRAGVTPERLIRLMYADIRKNPNLLEASQESLLGAMLTTIQLGLEPGGAQGDCWILPFRNRGRMEAQFMLGYKGMVKLYWNHPLAKELDTQTVHEGDDFDVEYGTNKHLTLRKARRSERGDIRCYYAQAHLTTGGSPFIVLDPEDVEALRARSASPNGPAWKSDYEAMAHKTCIRQLFTLLPKSVEMARGLARDGDVRTDLTTDGLDAAPALEPAQEDGSDQSADGASEGADSAPEASESP